MSSVKAIAAFGLCVLSFSAFSAGLTGNDLMRDTEQGRKNILIGFSLGYLQGQSQALRPINDAWIESVNQGMIESGRFALRRICVPEGVKLGQTVAVQEAWLNANPALWHKPVPELLEQALLSAWECKQEKK